MSRFHVVPFRLRVPGCAKVTRQMGAKVNVRAIAPDGFHEANDDPLPQAGAFYLSPIGELET